MTGVFSSMFDAIGRFLDAILPNMNNGSSQQMSDAVKFFAELIAGANYLFPVDTLFTVIAIVIGYKIIMFLVWCVNWCLRFIP